ncbi:serine-rich adhesin for platelets-like [Mytilus edulis]|uniref:serine-rich adhesin for platelets-like n=1 Tax=Mytilus edulis TaxID=6550 RepID=UPI0039EF7D0D
MKTTQQSYFPILFLLICGVLSWNYVSNTEKTPDGSLNFNQNTITKIERSSGGSTYDQNTVHVKYTERITNVSPNTKKTTAKEKERIPYGSPNSNDDTATKTERIPDASVDSHKNTATQTESISDCSTNNNKNTNTKIYRTPRGSVDLIHSTATQTERISYGWTNSDKKTDTQTEWTPRSSVNSISNTETQTESIYYDSTNNNKNTNKKTETTEEAPRGSVNSNQNSATQTERIPDSLKNIDKNTKTRTERTPRGSVNSNQHTATQTERISYGSANHTQHRKRYNQDLFTASWTTFNDGLLLGLNKSKENIPSEIRNTKINDTLNLLSGLSTQSTEHLTTLKELQRDPCQKYGTCSVAQNKTKWYCYCDSDCKMFNDCCSDYNGNIRNSNSQLSFECYPQTYVERSNSRTGFLAVGSCPNSYKNRTVKERCLQNNFTENGNPTGAYTNENKCREWTEENTITKIERSSGGSTYDQNTVHVKYTERITNVSPNTKKTTAKEKERIPYGSPNSNDDTATKTERIPDASVDSHKNTATQTESISDCSTNNNKNTNTKIYRTPRGSVDLIHSTATQTERISYGWTNSDKKTDTQTEWTPRSSVNSISNTETQTESIYYDSTNNNKNTNKKTETTEEAPRGSVNSNQNSATQTERIPDSLKNIDKNTKTRTERTPRGSVNSNQHTATQTERISDGSANHTQHRKRYNQDLFTASWTTFNDGLLLELNKSKENIPSEIRNTKINDTLNLLSGLSTQSTEHLTTLKELQRDPCQKYGTCSVAQNKTKWYCYCDSDCKMFNDCCSDYNGNIRNSNSQLSFECYPQTYVERSNSRTGFLAVGSCPNSYKNRTVKERCLQNNFTENGNPTGAYTNENKCREWTEEIFSSIFIFMSAYIQIFKRTKKVRHGITEITIDVITTGGKKKDRDTYKDNNK